MMDLRMSDLRCIQIHYQHCKEEINELIKTDRMWKIDAKGKITPIYFKIYIEQDMESLEPIFYEWVEKTKVYTGSSLCRFIRKKQPKIRALSENQYLNFLMSRKPYKKYF